MATSVIPRNWFFRLGLMLTLLYVLSLFGRGLTSQMPDHLGVHDGRLAPCSASPNSVSTQADDDAHYIEPLTFSCGTAEVISRLKRIIISQPRATIITETDRYLHFEFRSAVFRFVDDVEFLIDEKTKLIHFRSASRVGYGDLGVNRHRMDSIREAWSKTP